MRMSYGHNDKTCSCESLLQAQDLKKFDLGTANWPYFGPRGILEDLMHTK